MFSEEVNISGSLKIQQDSLKIELTRGMKGTYGWTICLRGQRGRAAEALAKLEEIDATLKKSYPSEDT